MAFIGIYYRLNALYFAVNSIFVVLLTHIWINFKLLKLYKKMCVVLKTTYDIYGWEDSKILLFITIKNNMKKRGLVTA